MAWFRRKAAGRHVLGAAVTCIPAGPPTPAAVPAGPLAAVPAGPFAAEPVGPAPVPVETGPADLMGSIAALLASGEAWASPGARPAAPQAAAEPRPVPAPDAPLASPPARTSDAPEPAVQQRRVQLGFRDGSSTTLDPTSSQSLELEELAASLTRRD